MNNEERIKYIEERIFRIEVGSDFLSSSDKDQLQKLREELRRLKSE